MNSVKLKAWYRASRPPFFVATMMPLILGGVLAAKEGCWDTINWLATLLASFFVHLNTNLANDYFDHLAGADDGDSIGGSRNIQQGLISLLEYRIALVLLYFLALCLGLWLLWDTRIWLLIPIMLFSFFSSLFYTAPPVRYGYHGLGELFVGINMGPIMVAGTYLVLTGKVTGDVMLLSLPTGIMVALILFYQSLPDIEADERVNKRTIAVRIGKKNAKWFFSFLVVITYFIITLLISVNLLHYLAATTVLTALLAEKILRMIRSADDWKTLHDRGGPVRAFYMLNSLIIIFAAYFN